jgi:uncharacterized membrane protein YhaH (DUF805 family)
MTIVGVIRNYFSFEGRISRAKYFKIVLMIGVAAIALIAIWPGAEFIIVALAFLPAVSASVKRFQDMNWSGWWFLLTLIPLINIPFEIILLTKKGTAGSNEYGEDPLLVGDKTEPQIIMRKREA